VRDYQLACSSWDDEEIAAINDVINSDIYSMGKCVAEFEEAFAKFVGSRYCVMVNSGSSANLLAVASLFYCKDNPLKPGDEVIVPAVSWSTTYYPLHQYGLKLKFVDIDEATLNYDLDALETAVTDQTRMIMLVNLLGNPNEFDKIKQLADPKDIILIEDNCEAMGATFNGKQAGTFGRLGTYSSFFSHHISTMEGGMIVTDDEELYHILYSSRSHGWTRGLPKDNKVCSISDDQFYESFRFVLPGYNLRPLEMSGAIGLKQLEKLPSLIEARRYNAKIFKELFSSSPHVSTQKEIGESSWFGFALSINDDAPFTRNELISALTDKKIECRPIVAGNFTRNPVINYFDYSIHESLTNADHIHDHGLFVGNHHFPLEKHLRELHSTIGALG
jgi:CDP-6-deoxy-D-xylo-4-hexulose-3-dehydrase